MPNICFKTRPNGRTVQLVRHVYSPATGRSQTFTVGSLSIHADPEDYESDLKPRLKVILDDADRLAIRTWLLQHGDGTVIEQRRVHLASIEARLRAEITASLVIEGDPLRQTLEAIATLRKAFPDMAKVVQQEGGDVWKDFRPRYLELAAEWDRWLKTAQANGVAKKITRRSKLAT